MGSTGPLRVAIFLGAVAISQASQGHLVFASTTVRSAAPSAEAAEALRGDAISPSYVQWTHATGQSAQPLPEVQSYIVQPDVTFIGATSASNFENFGGDPPDGAIAAGPNHILEGVNLSLSTYTKGGQKLAEIGFSNFFNTGAELLSDPRVLYDERSGRWLTLILGTDATRSISWLHIALSNGPDPLGSYCKYRFDMKLGGGGISLPVWADFPSLGVDDYGFTVSAPRLTSASGTYNDTKVLLIPRQLLVTCPSTSFVSAWSLRYTFPDFAPVAVMAPALVFGSPGVQYLVGTATNGGSFVALLELSAEGSGAELLRVAAMIPVTAYSRPLMTIQPGSALLIDSGDARVTSMPVYRNGNLWVAHSAAAPSGQAGVVTYQLNAVARQVAQRTFQWFAQGAYFQPSIMVDGSGNATLLMGVAGSADSAGRPIYPGGAYTTKGPFDVDFGTPQIFTRSTAPHALSSPSRPGSTRWGDYHGIALDPDGRRVWIESEYSVDPTQWTTAVASVTPAAALSTNRYSITLSSSAPAPGDAIVVSAQLVSASGIPLSTAGLTVTWTATGSGIFTPQTSTTDVRGIATTSFRTSATAATYVITATDAQGATGSSNPFTTVRSTNRYAVTVSPAASGAGENVSVTAQLQTAGGVPLNTAGLTVTWTSNGQGSFTPPTSITDQRGIATTSFRSASTPTTYVLTATDGQGATGSAAPFTTAARIATSTTYLPNVTKELGGALGWTTPFYVQNTGQVATDLDVVFFRFADGAQVAQRTVRALAPGASFSESPSLDVDLPTDTQFSVVIKSYGAPVAAVVAQIQGNGTTTEALLYTGTTTGANKVYLPNVTRRFFGYDVPVIIQNLGSVTTTATARFISFDGTQNFLTSVRADPGRSVVIDPDFTAGLVDGTQYAVTITADQPVSVVTNAHNEQGAPVAFSHVGLASGATTLLAPFAVKGGPDGQFSPVVIQNVGAGPSDVTLSFSPLGVVGTPQTFVLAGLAPGASRAFDPRFTVGTSTPCSVTSSTCLGSGEFSLKITATVPIAALVLPVSNLTADAYIAPVASNVRQFLPLVSRASGSAPAWTSRIAIDATSSGTATVRWYRMNDGVLASTTTVTLVAGTALWVDPRSVPGIQDGVFSVVIDATTSITTVVQNSYPGGDGSMFYAGFGPTL